MHGVPSSMRTCWPKSRQRLAAKSGRERQHHTQLDYASIHDPHVHPQRSGKQQTYTILTHFETTTGLRIAVLISKKGHTAHHIAQLHHWIVKHSFTKSILQSDVETSLMQLVNTMAADLDLPTRVSPPSLYWSQGKAEGLRRNLFDQLRSTRLQWSRELGTSTPHVHPEKLPRTLIRQSISIRELPLQPTAQTSLALESVCLETSATSQLRS